MMLLGTFFVCFATLFFEILSVRTMSFVLGSAYVYFVIGLAMLGMSAAGSFMSLFKITDEENKRARILYWSSILLGLMFMFIFFSATLIKHNYNLAIAENAMKGGLDGIVAHIVSSKLWLSLAIGSLMSLPYFIFGFILTYIFKTVNSSIYNKIYFADLAGGAAGAVIAYFFMEFAGYSTTVFVPVIIAMIGGVCFAYTVSQYKFSFSRLAPLTLAFVVVLPATSDFFEPLPQLNIAARDYDLTHKVTEYWHGWNSFSHITAVKSVNKKNNSERSYMSLGNGEGHALLIGYNQQGYGDWKFLPGHLAVSLGNPKKALVLFAGVGADMLAIDYYSNGESDITGVELNRKMIEAASSLKQFKLPDFYAKDNIHLHAEEARAFLERDSNKYNTIIISWSGATTAYYSGAMGHSTQFVYTKEAMESLFDHLTPDGMIVYMNTNKINSLIQMKEVMEERGLDNPEDAAIIFYTPGSETSRWSRWWDENRLLIKPSGFTRQEYEMTKEAVKPYHLEVAYSPFDSKNEEYRPYWDVLHSKDLYKTVEQINEQSNLYFSLITDDRPFSFDLFRSERYFTSEFWDMLFDNSKRSKSEYMYEQQRIKRILFVTAIIIGAVALILAPLLITAGPKASSRTFNHMLYFTALGAGFMLIEIGLMQKMVLLLGNPGVAISVVLATLIFFTGVGSLISNSSFQRALNFRKTVLLVLAYLALYLVFGSQLVQLALPWSLLAKMLFVVVLLAPVGILMGHLFPQGLRLASYEDRKLVPWAWAVNGATSTIAAGVAPLMAQSTGFTWVIVAGMLFYSVILILPVYKESAKVSTEYAAA